MQVKDTLTTTPPGVAVSPVPAKVAGLPVETVSGRVSDRDVAVPPSAVYTRLLSSALPRLLHVADPAPWRHGVAPQDDASARSTRVSYRRQAATLAIGMLVELEPGRADGDYLTEVIRSSLIRWQLSLRGDGRPLHRRSLSSPFHGATVGRIIQLLGETTGFQTPVLLADVERHLAWVSRRAVTVPWLEAATIGAMAEGAVLVRDIKLLARTRERLSRLLRMQDPEGWFPENAGADIGRLSLTVDALARLFHQNEWGELHGALQRAFRFLIHFVHPDGGVGGCYSARASAFASPYAAELMAHEFPEAAALALSWRHRCRESSFERLLGCDEDRPAAIGAGVAMAAVYGSSKWREVSELPCRCRGRSRFPNAGLTVVSTTHYHAVVNGRKGGAIHLTWRNGCPSVIDGGLTVVYPHRLRTSACMDGRTREESTQESISVNGVLRRAGAEADHSKRWWRKLKRWLRSKRRAVAMSGRRSELSDGRWATRDHYRREVTFGDDWVRIEDQVSCRLSCRAIICQSPPLRRDDWLGPTDSDGPCPRAPIFIEGGRRVSIVRLYRDGVLVEDAHGRAEPSGGLRLDSGAE